VPRRPSNRFVAAVMLGLMAAVAVLALLFAWDPVRIRQHDLKIPKPQSLSVPLVLRFGLGVYLLVLVYTTVRGIRQRLARSRGKDSRPAGRMAWRFAFPALALAGLVLIILVVQTTPKSRPALKPDAARKPSRSVPPAELAGLGYLPADTELALAVDVAGLLREVPAKERPERAALAAGLLGLDRVERATGLALAHLDHVVLGLSGGAGGVKFTLVAQTVKPYDPTALRRALQTRRTADHGKGPVYAVHWPNLPEALVWCAGPRTLVAVSRRGAAVPDPADLPRGPRAAAERLPPAVRAVLRQRPLGPGTTAWAAGRLSDPDVAGAVRAELSFLDPGARLAKDIRAVRASVRLDPAATLTVDVEATGPRAARELQKGLAQVDKVFQGLGLKGVRVTVSRAPKDGWVILQVSAPRTLVLGTPGGQPRPK
jgi:hypothetical protein